MRKILSLIFTILMVIGSSAQSKKKKKKAGYTNNDYEVTCIGVGKQGTKLIGVYGYGKKVEEATRAAKRNAIHGVIFRGVPHGGNGCQGIKPLAKSVTLETERQDFFEKFFAPEGPYLKFVAYSEQDAAARQVSKIDKKTYKVGIGVSVMFDALRKELENAGIIRKLTSGF